MKKNSFLTNIKLLGLSLCSFALITQCAPEKKEPFFKLSLAQWSINKMVKAGTVSQYDFARLASEWGFEGVEYVSQLYFDVAEAEDKEAALQTFVEKSKAASEKYGIQNVLIMIDHEGDLSAPDSIVRAKAVADHMGWVKAAAALGCHAVRVNLDGTDDPEEWLETSVAGLSELARQAAEYNINVIVENHGDLSSNIDLLMQVINAVNLPNCGTLPDFGNFCMKGATAIRDASCEKVYPIYQGVSNMLPKAFAVSAKAYEFDAQGAEIHIDYTKMLQLVHKAGYVGFVGVEYEGDKLSEADGIKATKALLVKAAQAIE